MNRHATLFSKGFMTGQASLSDVLDHHQKQMCDRIRGVTDLDQLTDAFLAGLVKEALVEPIHLHFDKMTRKERTEKFNGSQFPDPYSFNVSPGRQYEKLVSRISIPFTGNKTLLEYSPSTCSMVFPRGEVSGQAIQFDVIFWGYSDDNERIARDVLNNRSLSEEYTANANKQVAEFNKILPEQLRPVFEAKIEQLTRQISVFDSLGIKQEDSAANWPTTTTPSSPAKRSTSRAPTQIIQYVQNQFVEQLNQINRNVGDVNNAVQSS